jgi:TATA-binding protein-associated factor
MSGFLGTEAQFNDRFGKPILASRDARASSKALALEALHKQVLPFLMRRMKEVVLEDLPPKIIQDKWLEVWRAILKVAKRRLMHLYLKKLCNHPSFVLTPSHPQYSPQIFAG